MWWYGYGWWWWWLAFIIIFFLLPLGYGWGYRGWGPWYRRRPIDGDIDAGWGGAGLLLWIVLFIAIIWLIAAAAWGRW
jgi:H+/Cl- antiporter ClcA